MSKQYVSRAPIIYRTSIKHGLGGSTAGGGATEGSLRIGTVPSNWKYMEISVEANFYPMWEANPEILGNYIIYRDTGTRYWLSDTSFTYLTGSPLTYTRGTATVYVSNDGVFVKCNQNGYPYLDWNFSDGVIILRIYQD